MFDSNNKELASPNGGGDSSFPTSSFPWEDELAHKLAAKLLFLEKRRELENDNFVGQIRSVPSSSSSHQQYWGEDYVNQTYRSTANPRFKTEICRNFKEKGTCLYGDLCQFAHGSHELRPDVVRHSKYKTKLCQKYWIAGYCAYGPRCNFIHQEIEKEKALRILAGVDTGTRNGGVAYKASNPFTMGYGDLLVRTSASGRRGGSTDSLGDSDPELTGFQIPRVFTQSPIVDQTEFELSNQEKLKNYSLADLLPANFGLLADEEVTSTSIRRPIGSERLGSSASMKVSAYIESLWGSD